MQGALLELEKTCSGITVNMITSLMEALQQQSGNPADPVRGSNSVGSGRRRSPVTTYTVNYLLNRWEKNQLRKEEYLKYLVYLRQQQEEKAEKTLRKDSVRS